MNVLTFDFSLDLLSSLLWQYNSAAKLQALIAKKQAWYDVAHKQFWTNWITNVFDLTTANDFGLTVWAAILGVPLVVLPATSTAKPIWGFSANRVDFNQGNFDPGSNVTQLTQADARTLLRLRYFQLTTTGCAPEVNAFLATVFGPGVVYVKTTGPMACTYTFTALSSALQLVFQQFDVLPRPSGVAVTISHP